MAFCKIIFDRIPDKESARSALGTVKSHPQERYIFGRHAIATLAATLVICGLMALLAIHPCPASVFSGAQLSIDSMPYANQPRQSPGLTASNSPTLAPPRTELTPSFGQIVFLKVETDQDEIEVGWAKSALRER
ncbi:MAG: hypothetical protein ACWGMZ_01725 [Thermoguttaceae bacterium]